MRCLLLSLVFLISGGATAQEGASVPELVDALRGEDPALRHAAFEGAGAYGPEAIVPVAALLDSDDIAVRRAARLALEKMVGAASDDPEQRALAAQALLKAAAAVRDGHWLFWLLSYTGGAEAVGPLSQLYPRREDAQGDIHFALESILQNLHTHGPETAAEALRTQVLPLISPSTGEEEKAWIRLLGAVGSPAAAPILLQRLEERGEAWREAAVALGDIGAAEALAPIYDAMESTASPVLLDAYLRIAEGLEAGEAFDAYAALLELDTGLAVASQSAPGDREEDTEAWGTAPGLLTAALAGMGRTGENARDIDDILPYLAAPRADVAGAARAALIAYRAPRSTDQLQRRLRRAAPTVRAALLEVIAAREGEAARPLIEEALEDDAAEVRIVALALLGAHADMTHAETFLEAARSAAPEDRPVALQGYLRVAATALAEGDRDTALAMYHEALNVAERREERVEALQGLAAIADASSLIYLQDLPEDADVDAELARTAIAIADSIRDAEPDTAKSIYARILQTSSDRDLANRAQAALRAMGEEAGSAQDRGFLTNWQIIGPFPRPSFDVAFPPEDSFDADAVYTGANEQQVRWETVNTDDAFGVVTLDSHYEPKNEVLAYARAVFSVDEAGEVLVKVGSDDGVMVWLNGQIIHINDAARALAIDDDIKPATVRAGENELLLKVTQGSGDWAFAVRLTDPEGTPLSFTQP